MAGRKRRRRGDPNESETAGKDRGVRLFVAIELPVPVKDALARLQADIRETGLAAKWTRVDNIHLTLKFLGNTPVSAVNDIGAQLSASTAGFSPVRLNAAGLSVFPSVRRPRVMWTGLQGETERLSRLQQQVENHLAAIGFEKEGRAFTAHLTLARFNERVDPEHVISAIADYGRFASGFFSADAVCLFESRLTPRGPVYTRLQSHLLAGGA